MGIIKDVKGELRSGRATYNYASDAKNQGEKVLMAGTVNGLLDTPDEVAKEIFALEDTYKGDGQATAHLIYVWHIEDGVPTQEQAQDAAEQIMRDLGYTGPATWHGHQNEDGIQGFHIHLTASRVNPEPDESGEYKLHLYNGVQRWEDGQTNRYECLHHSMSVLCERHGWKKLDNMMFDENGQRIERPEDPDNLKYPKGIREWENHNGGVEHPWTAAAKESVKIFRESKNADEFFKAMADKGMSFRITDKMSKSGRISWGGVIKGPGDEVIKLSQLPKDCSIKCWFEKFGKQEAGDKNTPTPGAGKEFRQGQMTAKAVKTYARKCFNGATSMEEAEKMLAQKEMTVERYGKSGAYLCYRETKIKLSDLGSKYSLFQLQKRYNGNSSPHASNMHGSQSNVNASSMKDASKAFADRASDRATSATERAVTIAGEAVQAKTVLEALDDAEQQAFALDAARRASAQAAQATARAEAAEARARNLEKALKTKQPTEKTHENKDKIMTTTTAEKIAAQEKALLDAGWKRFNDDQGGWRLDRPDGSYLIRPEVMSKEFEQFIDTVSTEKDPLIYDQEKQVFVGRDRKITLNDAIHHFGLEDAIRARAGEPVDDDHGNFSVKVFDEWGASVEPPLPNCGPYDLQLNVADCAEIFEAIEDAHAKQSTNNDVAKAETENPGIDLAEKETGLKMENPVNLNSENEKMDRSNPGGILEWGNKIAELAAEKRKYVIDAENAAALRAEATATSHPIAYLALRGLEPHQIAEVGKQAGAIEDYTRTSDTVMRQFEAEMHDLSGKPEANAAVRAAVTADEKKLLEGNGQKAEEEFNLKQYVNLDLCSGPVSGTANASANQTNAPADGPRIR